MPRPGFIQRFRARGAQKKFQKKLDHFAQNQGIRPGLSAIQLKIALGKKITDEPTRNRALMRLDFIKK